MAGPPAGGGAARRAAWRVRLKGVVDRSENKRFDALDTEACDLPAVREALMGLAERLVKVAEQLPQQQPVGAGGDEKE